MSQGTGRPTTSQLRPHTRRQVSFTTANASGRMWLWARADSGAEPSVQANDVCSLRAAFARLDVEFHLFSLVQSAKSTAFDGSMVDKDFLSTFCRDESISSLVAEPLDGATGHGTSS